MEFDVTIEIPKGTRNKYEKDLRTGRIRLDRTLFTATQYPADYGFIENSIGPADDPLDALVLVEEPTFPGCLIRCRTFGIFRMRDENGPTPKVLCVPAADPRYEYLQDITDLAQFYRLEIHHFFEVYKALERGKYVDIKNDDVWASRAQAEAEIQAAYERAAAIGRTG
jgi:inorganic pyrophosphatase